MPTETPAGWWQQDKETIVADPNRLIIVGAGGLGREVAWLARCLPEQWEPTGFLDDSEELQGELICDLPVLGRISDWWRFTDQWFIVAVGSPRTRKRIVEGIHGNGPARFATLVHPSVQCSEFVTIGEGSILCAGSVLTTQVLIGRHCLVNLGAKVGHDVSIGDYCTLSPQATICGNVSVARGAEIGSGAVAVPGVTIGEGSALCAGSVVTKPIAPNILAAGSPARGIKALKPFAREWAPIGREFMLDEPMRDLAATV